jgi:hypothetical protein
MYPLIKMGGFGENIFGQPIFRIVFSDSRTYLAGGKWPDGASEYRETPLYPQIRGKWVMEKWLPAEEYGGTREQYERAQLDIESGLFTLGPYPYRGEYVLCHTFIATPTESSVGWAVHNLKISRDLTPGARKQGIMQPLEKQKREQDQRFEDIWNDAMGPFAKADTVVSAAAGPWGRAGFKRASDMPHPRADQQSILPTRDNFFGQIRRQETIDQLTGEESNASITR